MKHEIKSLQTKRALAESLKGFIQKKPLSKITVTDIVTDCRVNRKTFYYHFDSVYSLLRWSFEQDSLEIVKQFELALEYGEILMFIMDYLEANERLIRSAWSAMGLEETKGFFYNDFLILANALITDTEKRANIQLDEEYKQFLCVFYSTAVEGILLNWFTSKERADKQLVCDMIRKTVTSSFQGILGSNS